MSLLSNQDEHGNLKAVNFVIRRPCAIFSFLIAICLFLTFLLNILVFRTAKDGNPFTVPINEFNIYDVRSIQYDSLRLARDEVVKSSKTSVYDGQTVFKQSELADV